MSGTDSARVLVRRLPSGADLPTPARATASSAGFDLRACVPEPLDLAPGAWALVPTGLAVALPEGYEGQVRPRSGLAARHGLTLLNTPGTIDADYRGEVSVILVNLGTASYCVRRGDRIAQLIVQRLPSVTFEEVAELPETARGPGGFGHTGTR